MKGERLSILVVDDEEGIRMFFEELLSDDHNILLASNGIEALEVLENNDVDLIFLDLRMPRMDGVSVLNKIAEKKKSQDIPPYVIILTAVSEVSMIVNLIKKGAYDYITKPFNRERISVIIKNIQDLIKRQEEIKGNIKYKLLLGNDFVGVSKTYYEIMEKINIASSTDVNVMIYGESGVGKEIVAKLIHIQSRRATNNFVAIDCSSLPENIIESELFGYEKGAFTGAFTRKIGKFELANHGTVLLDEVNNLPLSLQAKLLRVIQEKQFSRIGGNEPIKVDVKIISTSNVDLKELIEKGLFREDLYYRLNVFPIYIPPLRERKDDIKPIAEHILNLISLQYNRKMKLTEKALEKIMSYDYPGNVRELQNILLRATISSNSDIIDEKDIEFGDIRITYFNKLYTLEELKYTYIDYVLKKVNNNISKASEILGISRRSIYNWIQNKKNKKI